MWFSAGLAGSVDLLNYMQQEGLEFTATRLTGMLRMAGACSHLSAAQWLRQHGAEWPAVLQDIGLFWTGDVLAWARAEGCTHLQNISRE
jgi:hypothetical protein